MHVRPTAPDTLDEGAWARHVELLGRYGRLTLAALEDVEARLGGLILEQLETSR